MPGFRVHACKPAAAILVGILAGIVSVGAAQPSGSTLREPREARAAGRLLVQPRAGVTLEKFDEILSSHGARRVDVIPQINVHVVELPPQANERAVARMLKDNPHIESAEIDERVPPSTGPGDTAPM